MGGKNVFSKNKSDAALKDFKLINLIGKGTFGKVYLVQQEGTGKQYAMKCIRKDIVL
jgi:serine/threonine protein kinase